MKKLILFAIFPFLLSCSEEKKQETSSTERSYYNIELKDHFLDAGMKVNVEITGVENDTLEIQNILFDEVWDRKFEKEGLYQKWFSMGFKKIIISTGSLRFRVEHDALTEYFPQ